MGASELMDRVAGRHSAPQARRCWWVHALAVVALAAALMGAVDAGCIGDGDCNCSGHGVCTRTEQQFNCECFPGWEGAACQRATCPTGKAWVGDANTAGESHFDGAVCSNAVRQHCVAAGVVAWWLGPRRA